MKEEIILHLVHCQFQIRLFHWATTGDAEHRALGELYGLLDESIDDFVETMIGKDGIRPKFEDEFSISFNDPSKIVVRDYLSQFKTFLFSLTQMLDPVKDTDLLNKRDEILGDVNHTLYLLTLKY